MRLISSLLSLSHEPKRVRATGPSWHGPSWVRVTASALAFALCVVVPASAQRGAGQGPAPTARAAAPVDLTGVWTSVVTEDWRWRMLMPPKGDYPSVPLTAAGRQLADQWDPAKDAAAGEQCRAFGAPSIMRMPGRIRISWEGDTALKVETEAGTQTRLFAFGVPPMGAAAPQPVPANRTWQGAASAEWQFAPGARRGGATGVGSLKVVTRGMRPGYAQRNGVPYSANAVVTEFLNRTNEPNGDSWLVVITTIEDPQYLTARWTRSSHFKKLAAGATFTPQSCEAS